MDESLIKLGEAELTGGEAQFNDLLLAQSAQPDIATTATHVLARLRQAGDGQVLDDLHFGQLGTDAYEFRVPALEAVSARAGNDVRSVLKLTDKRVYDSIVAEERGILEAAERNSPRLPSTRQLPDGLGRFLRHASHYLTEVGWMGVFRPRGRRDLAPLKLFSPEDQRLQRQVERRLAAFDPLTVPADRLLVTRELARLAPERLLFSLPELRAWSAATPATTPVPGAPAPPILSRRLEDIVGASGMNDASIVPVLAYLRGNPAHIDSLRAFYDEVQGGDEAAARIALNGTPGAPGLKPLYLAEKKRHDDVDTAFKNELETHDRDVKTYEQTQQAGIVRFGQAADRLAPIQTELEELLGLPDKISSIETQIQAIPPSPLPPRRGTPAPDPTIQLRADLEKERRLLTNRQSDLPRIISRRVREYQGIFAAEITSNPAVYGDTGFASLIPSQISTLTPVQLTDCLDALTTTLNRLTAAKYSAEQRLRAELDRRSRERTAIEDRRASWETYKSTPYADRPSPIPSSSLPNGDTLLPPDAAIMALRVDSLASLKSRTDDAEQLHRDALRKVVESPFIKNPLSPEILLYELQLRSADLAPLLSPERETRAMTRALILIHQSKSQAYEGTTRRRSEHIHVGTQPLAGLIDKARGGLYRPFDEIQRDTFVRDDRLKGVEGLTLTSSVRDVLNKVGTGALTEEQLQLYIHQLELLAQNRLEGANLAHGEEIVGLIHACRVAYYVLKSRTVLAEVGDRAGPLDKAADLRSRFQTILKAPDAATMMVETARVASNRRRLEEARSAAEAEEGDGGKMKQRLAAIEKWGNLAMIVLTAKEFGDLLGRVGRFIGRKKESPPPPT